MKVISETARSTIFVALAMAFSTTLSAKERVLFSIPRERADVALTVFAEQADISVLFPFDEISSVTTNALEGEFSVEEGLEMLLRGTGLAAALEERRNFILRIFQAPTTQLEAAADAGARRSDRRLDEVTVTGRRREENLQDVALSIEAFSAEDLESRRVEAGQDLNVLVPNLQFGRGSASAETTDLVIRGMPGVGVYVDGIWQGSRGFMEGYIVGLERIEVLRGPQGTLFGRNTNGGAIQYVTQPPVEELGGRVSLSLGEYSRRYLTTVLDLPLAETLHTRTTVARRHKDGFLKSLSVDRSFGHEEGISLREDILWLPTPRVDVRFVAALEDAETTFERQIRFMASGSYLLDAYNVVALNPEYGRYDFSTELPRFNLPISAFTPKSHQSGYPGGEVSSWETKSEQPPDAQHFDIEQYAFTVNWDIKPTLSLKSLTAYRNQLTKNVSDLDAAEITIQTDQRNNKDTWIQQEVHLRGSLADDRLNFLVGAFWSHSDAYERLYRWGMWEFFEQGPQGEPVLNTEMVDFVRAWGVANDNAVLSGFTLRDAFRDNLNEVDTTDRAVFGEVNYRVGDPWLVTIGMRWSRNDSKSITYDPTAAPRTWQPPAQGGGYGPGDPFSGDVVLVEHNDSPRGILTPKLSVTYSFTDDAMMYLSYAEGYTSGEKVYVPEIDQVVELDPEVVSTNEIGIRSDWLDDRLRFNATYFYSDWEGIRVPILPPDPNKLGHLLPLPYITSSGEARVAGLETELAFLASAKWQFNVSLGFLDTEYRRVGDLSETSLRFGAPFQFASDFSGSVGVQYFRRMENGGEVTFRVDYGYVSDYQRSAAIQRQSPKPEPGYGLLDSMIEYKSADGTWSAGVFANNLTNERYVDSGIVSRPFGLDFIQIGPPREIGLNLNYAFK